MNFELQTPNSELKTIFGRKHLLDDVLLQVQTSSPQRVLFWGDGAGGISSYVAGWMAGKGIDVILVDGANRFDPYMASSFARRALIHPERLLRRIRIARAFTCYQMATLMGERLVSLLRQEGAATLQQKSWVILLGPITSFLDEDVPEREVRPLFERSLRRIEGMAMGGVPFFIFQPSIPQENSSPFKGRLRRLIEPRRTYFMRRLFQFSDRVWRISIDDEGPRIILEKGQTFNKSLGHSVISHSMT